MNRSVNKVLRSSFSTTARLFTWGETTYGWGRPQNNQLRVPGAVEDFNDVTNVVTGPYHILFETSKNEVYSAGLGDHGRLGLNSTNSVDYPQLIHELKGLDVKQLAAGSRHSLALTKQGDVFSWGYGGGCGLLSFLKIFNSCSPLGHGNTENALTPRLVDTLKVPIAQISAGCDFSLALSTEGKVYGWGQGLNNLAEEASSTPVELEEVNFFLHRNHQNVVKMRSVDGFTFFLLENGRLYVLGKNNGGVFATRKNPLINLDSSLLSITKVIDEDYKDEKIVNFDVSANSLIFETDAGSIFYSGMHSKFRPTRFPQGNAKKIFATYDSVGIINNNDKIVFINDQFIDDADKCGDCFVSDDPNLKEGVVEVGGTHKLRYALVRN